MRDRFWEKQGTIDPMEAWNKNTIEWKQQIAGKYMKY